MRLLRVLPMLLVMGGIFWASHQPGSTIELPLFPGSDKLLHGLAYGLLAWCALLALGLPTRRPGRRLLLALAICGAYGASDELHQMFVPGRAAELGDWLADILGAAAVLGAWAIFQPSPRARAASRAK